jgi:hypothetical protein
MRVTATGWVSKLRAAQASGRVQVSPGSATARRHAVVATIYVVLAAAVAWPFYSVSVPSLGDTLNHVARIHILMNVGHSETLSRFYSDVWRLVPYFGMDAPVALLAPALGLYGATTAFVMLCALLPVMGAATLHYVLHRRLSLVPATAFLLSYNYLLARGFLPYLFMAGLAVMLFAGWIASAAWPRWRRAAAFAPLVVVLYLGHAFAFAAYGILVAAWECGRAATHRPRSDAFLTLAAAASQALPALALAFIYRAGAHFGTGTHTHYGTFLDKVAMVLSPLFFPGHGLVMGLFALVPVAAVALAPRVRIAAGMTSVLVAAGVAALLVPSVLLNVWGADFRLPLVVAIVLIGSASPRPNVPPFLRAAVLAVVALMVLLRSADAWVMLRAVDRQLTQIRDVLKDLPRGARLLVVDAAGSGKTARVAPFYITGHIAMVAAIEHDAFVPFLFTGTTPVQVRPAFANAASPSAEPLSMAQLIQGASQSDPPAGPPAYGYGGHAYWLGWPAKFDDVLIIHFDGPQHQKLPGHLLALRENPVATLYAITQ